MSFYKYLFIFALFSIVGWVLELIYRSLINKKLINPGFMSGCVVPLYGMGAIILNVICIIITKLNIKYEVLLIFITSTIFLTLLEFICGFVSLKYFHIRLWDYRKRKFNYKGFVCLEFSIVWGLLSVLYYTIVYPKIDIISLNFVSSNLGVFLLGIFLGIFIIDLSVSIKLLNRLINYAKEMEEIINVERLKLEARINTTRKKFWNAIYPYLSTNKYLREKI
ncbi:MAG: putative ABC transporter permease, partial [Helicobacter sp.]|nr:putative ABC transporter permease [Helicobacter sp.]